MGARTISWLGTAIGGVALLFALLRVRLAPGYPVAAHHDAADQFWFWFWIGLGVLAALALFFGAFALLRKARLLEDMPTSRIRSAAQGYVELEGYARLIPGPPVASPLSRQRCAWWSYSVRHYDSNSRKWETIESETSGELFVIADATGNCIVDPEDAQVTPSLERSWRGRHRRPHMIPKKTEWFNFGDYAYTEKQILVGDMLCATGQFRTQSAILEMNESKDVSELLALWKRDKRVLLERFDTNKDGEIDLAEWEAARREAITLVRREQVQQSLAPDIHVLSRPSDGRPFILSTQSQDQLTRRYRAGALLCLLCSALLAGTLYFLLVTQALS